MQRFLEHVSNSSLTQMVNEPTIDHALLILLLANQEELDSGVIISGKLGCKAVK